MTKLYDLLGFLILFPILITAQDLNPLENEYIIPHISKYTVFQNIQYDTIEGINSNLLSLDIYVPNETESPTAVVIYIHGGGWHGGDKSNLRLKDEFFIELGYILVSMNYRLSPSCPPCDLTSEDAIRFPDHPNDVATGVAWVFDNIKEYGGDPKNVSIIGHSAGAHLSALISTNEFFLNKNGKSPGQLRCACILDAAIFDLPFQMEFAGGTYEVLLLNAFGSDPTIWLDASPAFSISPDENLPDFLLIHQNELQRILQNELMRDSLSADGHTVSNLQIDLSHSEINILIGADSSDINDFIQISPDYIPSDNIFELSDVLNQTIQSFFQDCTGKTVVTSQNLESIDKEISISPNPTSGQFRINEINPEIASIAILDKHGRILKTQAAKYPTSNLNIDSLPAGTYFIALLNKHGIPIISRKLIKN